MGTQRAISRRRLRARIGTELEVLVDGPSEESDFLLEGRFFGQAPEVDGKVYLANGTAQPGQLRRALVTGAADYDLTADLLDAVGRHDAPPGQRRVRRLPTVSA
jgi:ribosomal protein S12 methylthiotransferase